jgi:ABC-type iron transport system FetAB permease component
MMMMMMMMMMMIIIIIIIRHELGLDRPVSTSSNSFFEVLQVVFVHSVHNSALFLTSCCCSFLLHVLANLICILLVSRQLVLLSYLPKFLHSFCGQKGCTGCSCEKFNFDHVNHFLSSFFLRSSNFAST